MLRVINETKSLFAQHLDSTSSSSSSFSSPSFSSNPVQSSSVGLESNQRPRRAETRSFFDERVSLTGVKWPENDNVVQRRRVVGSNDSPSSAPSAGSSRLLTRPPLEFGGGGAANTRSHTGMLGVVRRNRDTDRKRGWFGARKRGGTRGWQRIMERQTAFENGNFFVASSTRGFAWHGWKEREDSFAIINFVRRILLPREET